MIPLVSHVILTLNSGWGIYALVSFQPNEVLFKAKAKEELKTKHSHSIQKDFDTHVIMDLPARFINHSCDANTGIVDNNTGAYDFVALKSLEIAEELTWVSSHSTYTAI